MLQPLQGGNPLSRMPPHGLLDPAHAFLLAPEPVGDPARRTRPLAPRGRCPAGAAARSRFHLDHPGRERRRFHPEGHVRPLLHQRPAARLDVRRRRGRSDSRPRPQCLGRRHHAPLARDQPEPVHAARHADQPARPERPPLCRRAYRHGRPGARHVLDARLVSLSLGVVGPGALGRQVQNGFHDIIGDTENKGWHYQIQDQPAVQVLGQRTWRLPIAALGPIETDALPSATVSLGRHTGLRAGGRRAAVRPGPRQRFRHPAHRARPQRRRRVYECSTICLVWFRRRGWAGSRL